METAKKSTGKYAFLFLLSLAACIAFLVLKPEWFWVTLPFLITFLVKTFDAL